MIFEHEIPSGSKLYFGNTAKIKREIETDAAVLLTARGFDEMVTPFFSYHQHDSFENQKTLIRLNDEHNHEVTLRADSTPDIVRIATKRLGRSTESKKWFYIQPVVAFPTKEQYQIGGEILQGTLNEILEITIELINQLGIKPILQLANIRIPYLLSQNYGISLELLKSMHIEAILGCGLPWIEKLIAIHTLDDLVDLSSFPNDIQKELEKLRDEAMMIKSMSVVISPLYYAKMRYYDSLTFKMFLDNALLARGGVYTIDGVEATGFTIYTDECISIKTNQGQ